MITIEMTHDDAVRLTEVLESYVGDLRAEITRTDDWSFRAKLKAREAFVDGMIEKLAPELTAVDR